MRRQTPIAQLLYNHLYPKPTSNDPASFSAHLARNLVPEVRIEVATFYGDLNSIESRYPGLDYCHPPHRMRLGRFKHHRKLFDAFENLGLTYTEIQDFCCWEGTKWARERYEKDEGVIVEDTTGCEIQPWVNPRRKPVTEYRRHSITRKTDISVTVENTRTVLGDGPGQPRSQTLDEDEDEVMGSEEESSEAEAAYNEHVANVNQRADSSINQRLMQHWRLGSSIPPEIEAYLKEQSEAGNLSPRDLQTLLASTRPTNRHPVFSTHVRPRTTATAVSGRAAA